MTTQEREALLPCPFCGSNDLVICEGHHNFVDAKITCSDCVAEGPLIDDESESASKNRETAIVAWNHRAAQVAAPPALPISQEMPEKVQWIREYRAMNDCSLKTAKAAYERHYLATPQPATEQAELSDDELLRMFYDDHAPWYFGDVDDDVVLGYARAVLAAAKGEQQ